MKKIVIIGVAVLVVTAALLFWFMNRQADAPQLDNTASTSNSASGQQLPDGASREITLAEVQQNNSASSCWTIIGGSVYDVTAYIKRHPGGDTILLACGKDGTTLFTERKTQDGQTVGDGGSHSEQARSQLAQYRIGVLAP